jgi:hypothetical protein
MLTLQQMIDGVLAGAEGQALSKIAQAADEYADESASSEEAEGESKAPPRKSKEELEREAEKEEKAQGGGQDPAEGEDTDQERVEKMASAVEEVVRLLLDEQDTGGKEVTAQEGAPENATQMPTNVKQAPEAEDANFGEAKAKIPENPPQEKVLPAEKGQAAMATNEAAQAEEAKVAAAVDDPEILAAARNPEAMLAARKSGQRSGGILGGLTGGTIGGVSGGLAGSRIGGGSLGATLGGAALGAAIGGTSGALAGRPIGKARGGFVESDFAKRHPITGALIGGTPGVYGGMAADRVREAQHDAMLAEANKKSKGKRKTGSLQSYVSELLEKSAADPSSPQASVSAAKSDALPEDRPLNAPLAAGAEGQRAMISSNEAAMNLTKRQAKALPKQQLGNLLSEKALTSSTDKALDQTLGAQTVSQAGAKIANERKLKIAAARALISKIASEGCTCETDGSEKGTCRHCKVASRLECKPGEKSEKKAQMSDAPGASNVPPTVESSPSGAAAAPQM